MQVGEAGMTLLEVLLAMAVLALGVFASAALQLRSLQVSDSAHLDGQAVRLAQNMLERARAVGSLTAGEEAAWRSQVVVVLGPSAEGRVSRAAGELSLELEWSAPGDAQRPSLSLQGKVSP
ncbi:type IV pilus modification protein PilV [Pseudomonas entomophila]|uniref:type IV pilus modification protein PilV n=1 Tax=Pseudomonas entomophila TaxID=312306 RepID=UPI0024064B85|nr:type IV pilus modification protein PilV [Pseudomonas entomophila]MDF9618545.1 type IV pilus modification protein PilV [Pseudomonas entomophila]